MTLADGRTARGGKPGQWNRRAAWAATLVLAAAPLRADRDDPGDVEEYVAALQAQGYGDLAAEYLQAQLAAKPPPDVAADLELQLAMLLADNAGRLGDLPQREQALREARQRFVDFARARPHHPRSGEALAALAGVDLQQARLRAAQAQLPSYSARATELAAEARASFAAAVAAYDKAAAGIGEQWSKLPLAVDDDPESRRRRAARARAASAQIQAEFQAAYAQYLFADSFRTLSGAGGADPAQALADAERRFGTIFERHRQYLVAPFARVFQARCIAARGETNRAKGIFEEILANKDKRLAAARRQAAYFELLSLAADGEDATLAGKGEEWLRANDRTARPTNEGLGVRLEVAAALRRLAEKTADAKARDERLRRANFLLETVAAAPNEHQGAARKEQFRVEELLDLEGQAKTFEQALSRGTARMESLPAGGPERAAALTKAAALFEQAVALAKPADPAHKARLQRASALYDLGKHAEAAALAAAEATEHGRGPGGQDGASLAFAAYAAMMERGDAAAAGKLEALAKDALQRWSGAAVADEARLALAALALRPERRQSAEALALLEAVPANSARRGEARFQLAQLLLEQSRNGGPPAQELAARGRAALAEARPKLAESRRGRMDRTRFLAEALHAETLLDDGAAAPALDAARPLVAALGNGTAPADLPPSAPLAVTLRGIEAAIAAGQAPLAEQWLALAGKFAGADASKGTTQAYLYLAGRLKERVERLRNAGDDRAGRAAEEAYEKFVDALAAREGQTLATLAFAGTAFAELGRLDKANQTLDRALALEATATPADKPQLVRAKFARIKCLSAAGRHAEAVTAARELGAAEPLSAEAQFALGHALLAAGQAKEAAAHWTRLVNATSRRRPPEFYEAVYWLHESYRKYPDDQRPPMVEKATKNLKGLLANPDARMSAAAREKLERQRKELAGE